MTTIQATKTDGKPVNFNFKLENGLPYKPFIGPTYGVLSNDIDDTYDVYVDLNTEEMEKVKSFQSKNFHLINEAELWVELENNYIIFTNLPEAMIKSLRNLKTRFLIFDNNKEFLCSIGF